MKRKENKRKRWSLVKMEKLIFMIHLVTRSLRVVNAASEDLQNSKEKMEGGQCNQEVARIGWYEKRKLGKDPRSCEKYAQDGDASTSKDNKMRSAQWFGMEHGDTYMERYKGTYDVFSGVEHRKEEMEEMFTKRATPGRRFAADAARITYENAGSEECMHASGGVFVTVDNALEAVVDKEEGAVKSIPAREGRIAQA